MERKVLIVRTSAETMFELARTAPQPESNVMEIKAPPRLTFLSTTSDLKTFDAPNRRPWPFQDRPLQRGQRQTSSRTRKA